MNIKNLTNSPYELMDEDGKKVVLPARGEINGFKPHPMQIGLYRSIGYFKITDNAEPAKDVEQEDDPVVEQQATEDQPKRRGRPPKAQE
jgi:hypothetical protein